MPYKDKSKRKDQWARWGKAHKDDPVRKYKNKARALARQKLVKSAPCSIKGCKEIGERHHPDYSKPLEVVWLCNKHHDLLHRPKQRVCTVEGCGKLHRAKGLCNNHWRMAYIRNISADSVKEMLAKGLIKITKGEI